MSSAIPPSTGDARRKLRAELVRTMSQVEIFSRRILRRPLRAYQLAPAQAIVDSVLGGHGLTFAVMMARQAGKNETAAHVEALLLNLFRRRGGYLVKASPTFTPQTVNSIQRLSSVLEGSLLGPPVAERGYILRLDRARAAFYSASPGANVVGATANILLEADEAQDIAEAKWNKDFRPMGASTNVTTVLWGTAWTSETLLARTIRALRWAESKDQVRRVFVVPWKRVAEEVPAYGRYVRGEIQRLGSDHPLIKTQYRLEEIDGEGGMFPPGVRALMHGAHPRQRGPTGGREYAILVDVAGESEERVEGALLRQREPRKDSTALTIVEIAALQVGMPRFLVMDRYYWTGTPHPQLYSAIVRLAELWAATRIVVDATGVGAGLASFLRRTLGPRVEPFVFSASSKSDLGWGFLGICSSGRFLDYRDDGGLEWRQFWREIEAADFEIVDGPNKRMRWGVADPTVHDDLLMSAALVAVLDQEQRSPYLDAQIIEAADPLSG
ncbi:MAG: hypothetical protein E3J25_04875 [Anaerolineales bacterium]|nr:MAG: hypothetical protein E3J25_04875 [Anaerolineales bacterium]